MRIIIFGTGLFFENRKEVLFQEEIAAFADNNIQNQGKKLYGIDIIAPHDILKQNFQKIIIMTPKNSEAIRQQLIALGIPDKEILDYSTFQSMKRVFSMTCYYPRDLYYSRCRCICVKGKKILMISHELEYAGAPVVLYYAAKLLKEKGYEIVVASPIEGPLCSEYMKEGIKVVVDNSLRETNSILIDWFKKFDIIFICTLAMNETVKILQNINIPIIWWLHEAEAGYQAFWNDSLWDIDMDKVSVYTGGDRALKFFCKYFRNGHASNLLYGVPDKYLPEYEDNNHRNIVFALIGTVNERKAQDIFLEAVEMLPDGNVMGAEFWIIGKFSDNNYCDEILKKAESNPNIKILGEVSLDELSELYKGIDVVVCPSRDDPMPVILTDAMMLEKVCIVSDHTGTASLITDRVDGFIFKSGEARQLAVIMGWAAGHPSELKAMGKKARKIYEDYFTMECFKRNLSAIIEREFGDNK